MEQQDEMSYGRITHYNSHRGFGFIACTDGNDYFFHVSSLSVPADKHLLRQGMRCEFSVAPGRKPGSVQALNILLVMKNGEDLKGPDEQGPDESET